MGKQVWPEAPHPWPSVPMPVLRLVPPESHCPRRYVPWGDSEPSSAVTTGAEMQAKVQDLSVSSAPGAPGLWGGSHDSTRSAGAHMPYPVRERRSPHSAQPQGTHLPPSLGKEPSQGPLSSQRQRTPRPSAVYLVFFYNSHCTLSAHPPCLSAASQHTGPSAAQLIFKMNTPNSRSHSQHCIWLLSHPLYRWGD